MTLLRRLIVAVGLLGLAACLAAPWWLPSLAYFLIEAEEPSKADTIVVIGGDWSGQRILRACELSHQGFAPTVLVSGPMDVYGVREDVLSIALARSHGHAGCNMEGVPVNAESTKDEAEKLGAELRRRGFRRVLIVTNDFHTRRAGRLWRQTAPYLDIHMVAAPTNRFDPLTWWKDRQARKTLFLEWVKTLTSPFGV